MKVSTGIKEMDKMIGGFPKNTVILVSGGPGTGKTLFTLNFLMEGARKKERCCYVSLSETEDEIIRACKDIKSLQDIGTYLGKNLVIEHIKLGENTTLRKFMEIMASYPRIDRLVIDSSNKLLLFSESQKIFRVHFSELVRQLKGFGCTLMICETGTGALDSGNNEAFECDGVVHLSFLDLEEKPMRTVTIHKLRYSSFDPKVPRELLIDRNGIHVNERKVI